MLTSMTTVLASIPSPSFNTLEIGPLTLRLYGLCIALGVIAAVVISSKRWEARGGNPDDIGTIALWAVPAGVIGARLYHVATDWKTYQDDWAGALKITNGGLGIPGGVAAGVIVGIIVVKRKHLPVRPLLDVVAPAIPVAQAIGRLGNWFNQELYGRPTSLPWGLEIDAEHRLPGYESVSTFHPTFLYEALWNLGVAGLLIWIDKKRWLRPGELFLLYAFGYSVGRLWVEEMRIDPASLIWGVRVNIWMSVIVGVTSAAILIWNRRPGAPVPTEADYLAPGALEARAAADATPGADDRSAAQPGEDEQDEDEDEAEPAEDEPGVDGAERGEVDGPSGAPGD